MKLRFKYIFLWQLIILLLCTSLPVKMFASENNLNLEFSLKNSSKVYFNNIIYDYDAGKKIFNKQDNSLVPNEYFNNNFDDYEKVAIKNFDYIDNKLNFNIDDNLISFFIDNELNAGRFNKIENNYSNKYKLSIKASSLDISASLINENGKLIIKHKKANEVLKNANQLSAIILNNNKALYYGKINEVDAIETTLEIPKDLNDGEYKLLVFAEQINDNNYSNYSSAYSVLSFNKNSKKEINHECENGILCSHLYRDLDDNLNPLCSKGKMMLESDDRLLSTTYNEFNNSIKGIKPSAYNISNDGTVSSIKPSLNRNGMSTDGIKGGDNYEDFGNNKVYIEYDLGVDYKISDITLWRYKGYIYHNTVIAVSKDKEFTNPTIIYNADNNNIFKMNKSILNPNNYDLEYNENDSGLNINLLNNNITARYIRVYMNGNNQNTSNHIVEIEVNAKKVDKYFNQGIYFVAMTNLVNEQVKYHGIRYDNIIDSIDAYFLFDDNDISRAKIYRMVELENGIFTTVVPPSLNKEIYSKIFFNIKYHDKENNKYEFNTNIIYDFTALSGTKDHIIKDYDASTNTQGIGEFSLESDVSDCYYWQCGYEDSYWSGRPSSDNSILDDKVLYVDNSNIDLNTESATNIAKPLWDKVYISYLNNDKTKFISQEIILETRHPLRKYYLFPKGINITENTLIAISNGELNIDGTFKDNTIANKEIMFFLYNIGSKDNTLLLRNIGKSNERIFTSFETKPNNSARYIGFRDQLHNTDYAIIPKDKKLFYRLAKAKVDGSVDENTYTELKPMVFLGSNNTNFPNIDHDVLFFTEEKVNSEYKYISFFREEISPELTIYIPLTEYLLIDDSASVPTFFADPYQQQVAPIKVINKSLKGYFTTVMQSNYHADITNDIPYEANKSYNPDYLYGNATFYDYYDDSQLIGYPIGAPNDTEIANQNDWRISSRIFNEVVHDYYVSKNIKDAYPLYLLGADEAKTRFDGSPYFNKEGIFDPVLKLNKNPNFSSNEYIIADGNVDKTLSNGNLASAGVINPLFDESFLRGDNSLNTALGNVYKDVSFPFKLNKDGYWEFDSIKAEYATRLKEDPSGGYYLDLTNAPIVADKQKPNTPEGQNGFFPFNDASDKTRELNYHFGMKMDINFSITEDGKIKIKKDGKIENRDIEFKFRGDDDFILFIDDVLILDLTGIHAAVNGVINFATGDVSYSATNFVNGEIKPDLNRVGKQTNLYEALNAEALGPKYLSDGNHTIRIFYTERGRGASNLKIEFNFPKKNTLEVTNEVDTSSASNIFSEVLEYIGGFRYSIMNQATSGIKLDVKDSTNHLSTEAVSELNFQNQKIIADQNRTSATLIEANPNMPLPSKDGKTLKITNLPYTKHLSQIQMKEFINLGYYWNMISSSTSNHYNLSKYSHLSFNVYNKSSIQSNTGIILNIKMKDVNGEVISGGINEFVYESHSNSLPVNKWSIVRIDLNKMLDKNPGFDISNVKEIGFALGVDQGTIYLNNLRANGKLTSGVSLGFSVTENEISDYTSLDNAYINNKYDYNKAILKPIDKSWYKASSLNNDTSTIVSINQDSTFDLANLDKITFTDKFREGSYIYLKQSDETKNSAFRTTWSILENAKWENGKYVSGYIDDNYLALYPGKKTVVNDMNHNDLSITNQKGTIVGDHRTVMGDGEMNFIFANDDPNINPNINFNSNGKTFVYRSYLDPDNLDKGDINLTVAYKNELITGGLIITKKLVDSLGNPYVALKDETYNFHIKYQDVMGTNLENNIYASSFSGPGVLDEVSLTIPKGESSASIVVYGIPKNTKYIIHEVNEMPKEILYDDKDCRSFEYANVLDPNYVGSIDTNTLKELNADSNLKHSNILKKDTMIIENELVHIPSVEGVTNNSLREFVFTNEIIENPKEITIEKQLNNTIYSEPKSFIFHVHYKDGAKDLIRDVVVGLKAYESSNKVNIKLPNTSEYIIHEVNDDNFDSMTLNGNQLNSIDYSCQLTNRFHKAIKFNENGNVSIIKAINRGPQSLIIRKNALDNNIKSPLKSAEFTILNKGEIIDSGQLKTNYYYANSFDVNDKNYDKNINRYKLNGVPYIVNKIDNNYEYYVPLTKEEIIAYENKTLINSNKVVALAIFSNIKLRDGTYIIKETNVPSGFKNNDGDITLSVSNGKIDVVQNNKSVLISDLNHSHNDIQIEVNNNISDLAFYFYKQNRHGDKLSAEFELYEINEQYANDLLNYGSDGLLDNESKSKLNNRDFKQNATSDEFNDTPVYFRRLSPEKTYRLIETKEPIGYKKPEGQWNIKYDNKLQKFIIIKVANPPAFTGNGTQNDPYILLNYRYTDIPSTGGVGNIQIYGLAIMFVATGCLLYEVIKRNKMKGN